MTAFREIGDDHWEDRCEGCVAGWPLDTRGMTHLNSRGDGTHSLVACTSASGVAARAKLDREFAEMMLHANATLPIAHAPMMLGDDEANIRKLIESHIRAPSIGLILDSEMVHDGTDRITEEERTP